MGQFIINTKAANVTFGNLATSATALTFLQLPSVVCDEVVISLQPAATPQNVLIAGNGSPGSAYVILPTSAPTLVIKTGGNLSNLWVANAAGTLAQGVGYMTIQYKPVT